LILPCIEVRNALLLRPLLFLLLLAGLDSCAVYDRIFHPHRIPTPPMSAEYKAKLKADKAKKKGAEAAAKQGKKDKKAAPADAAAPEGSTDASTPDFAADNEANKATDEKAKKEPSASKVKYDKQGLMKKSKMFNPKPRHTVSKPSAWQRFKNVFRKRHGKKKAKPQSNPTPNEDPLPDPTTAP
jgi:hypothetical protein